MERFVCIHGHFYQPPRENPWLEDIEIQDSAYPHHDWNERITAECYEPNAASRILNGQGRIERIVNNYSRISFNFGPTLLAWMQRAAPEVYEAILQADRESRQRFSGHGSALAQCYNHAIMPLCNRRDKVTQVRWGIADFKHRFGRKPEGMWLPETAVDLETLDILAEHGIRFTILSPYQAKAARKHGGRREWDATGGHLDPTTPYDQQLPSGRHITVFFYDGPISQAIAFEHLLRRGEDLVHRLTGAFTEDRNWPQLVHVATDGESYGHHHPHGDMALAYALHSIQEQEGVRLTNYGQYLDRYLRIPHIDILENTAWSCAHGVERWRSDCGCNSGGRPGWSQQWRGPLREALDWLRDTLVPKYEEAGRGLLRDPWVARDEYISVVLDRSPASLERFFRDHATRRLAPEETVRALKLLELQRHAMLMYTSCGWFFDELSGIETVQVMQYAGRVVQLAEELFHQPFEGEFTSRLARAESNLPEHGNGRKIYEKWGKPSVVDGTKVAAHYAASSLFEDYGDETPIYCYQVERREYDRLESGRAKMAVGCCRVTSTVTQESNLLSFACIHFGDHNLLGGVRPQVDEGAYTTMSDALRKVFGKVDFPEMVRQLDQEFEGAPFSLSTLFREEQRKILNIILAAWLEQAEAAYRHQYEEQTPLAAFLGELGIAIPTAFRTTAQLVLNADLERALAGPELDFEKIRSLLHQATTWQVKFDEEGLNYVAQRSLEQLAQRVRDEPDEQAWLDKLAAAVDVVELLPFKVNKFRTQNIVYRLLHAPEADTAPFADKLRSLAEKLAIRVPDSDG